jgi:hypothetical protein
MPTSTAMNAAKSATQNNVEDHSAGKVSDVLYLAI